MAKQTHEKVMEQVEYKIHQPLIKYLNDELDLFEATAEILSIPEIQEGLELYKQMSKLKVIKEEK